MKRKLLLIVGLASLTLCSGCFKVFVPVDTPWPRINHPEMPQPPVPDTVTTNKEKQLVEAAFTYRQHAVKLTKIISVYNEEAEKHNKIADEQLFGE